MLPVQGPQRKHSKAMKQARAAAFTSYIPKVRSDASPAQVPRPQTSKPGSRASADNKSQQRSRPLLVTESGCCMRTRPVQCYKLRSQLDMYHVSCTCIHAGFMSKSAQLRRQNEQEQETARLSGCLSNQRTGLLATQ